MNEIHSQLDTPAELEVKRIKSKFTEAEKAAKKAEKKSRGS